ncbi:MAG: cell division protein FtsZ, partial [Actinomycetota bacterium]
QGASDLGLHEIDDAARLVQEAVHPEANIIFGATIDDTLGDEVRITVIAAGFDGGAPKYRKYEAAAVAESVEAMASTANIPSDWESAENTEVEVVSFFEEEVNYEESEPQTASREKISTPGRFGDDLDLPEFFR